MLKIGNQLRRLRIERGEAVRGKPYTQNEVAIAAGVQVRALGNIENNRSEPGAETMARIADFLGVTMDELRDDRHEAVAMDDLIEAARRVQAGDRAAGAELQRIVAALTSADVARVSSEANATAKKKAK